MNISRLRLIKVDIDYVIKPFDCGDDKLNDFLFNRSKFYHTELLATTFVLENDEKTVGYYSILNDSFRVDESFFESKAAYKSFLRELVPHSKRHLKYFPATKIGRLAVHKLSQKAGIGNLLLSRIIEGAINQNEKCACKVLTVDAYEDSHSFYEKIGFKSLSSKDDFKNTRQMYLNLTPLILKTNLQKPPLSLSDEKNPSIRPL